MKNTKRVFCFLLGAAMISGSAFADITIENVDIDYDRIHVSVSGKTDTQSSPVGIRLSDGSNSAAFGQARADNDGKFSFAATLDGSFCDKNLTLALTQVGENKTESTIKVYSIGTINAWLEKVNSLSADWKTETARYYDEVLKIMIDDNDYYAQNTDALLDMVSGFKNRYKAPKEFALDINRAIILDKINKTDAAGVKALAENERSRELLSVGFVISDDAYALTENYKKDNTASETLKKSGTGFGSPSDFVLALREANCIALINSAKADGVKGILTEYRDVLSTVSDSADEIISGCTPNTARKVSGEGLTKISTILSTLKSAIDAQNTAEDGVSGGKGNGGGGGGAGGGGGGKGGSSSGGSTQYGGFSQAPEPVIEPEKFDAAKGFSDLGGYEWATEAIDSLAGLKIISGTGGNTFEPERTVSREEFVKMAVMLLGIYDGTAECSFGDVSKRDWFYPYVASASKNGLVSGMSEDVFGAGEKISREDIVTILSRAIESKNIEIPDKEMNFSDMQDISDYAQNAVKNFYALGVVSGMEDGSFAPKRGATRAESACIIYNVYRLLNR